MNSKPTQHDPHPIRHRKNLAEWVMFWCLQPLVPIMWLVDWSKRK